MEQFGKQRRYGMVDAAPVKRRHNAPEQTRNYCAEIPFGHTYLANKAGHSPRGESACSIGGGWVICKVSSVYGSLPNAARHTCTTLKISDIDSWPARRGVMQVDCTTTPLLPSVAYLSHVAYGCPSWTKFRRRPVAHCHPPNTERRPSHSHSDFLIGLRSRNCCRI